AALGERFRDHPRLFRWLAPQFLVDQTYVMALDRPELAGRAFRRYWMTLGVGILIVWSGSIALGIAVAPVLPPLPHLALVGTALFVGLLLPRVATRPAVVAALAAAATAGACFVVLPALAIVAGALAGVTAGVMTQRRQGRAG